MSRRQGDAAIAPGLDVGQRLQRWRGGHQHRRRRTEPRAHHRHVAGVVDHAFLLLECGLVLLVDHHEAEVGERQEQRRPGAHHDRRRALRHRAPGHAADPRGEVGVPHRRRDAEAALEPLQPLRGQRDLRQQHQRLAALAQALRHRLQVDLGLAGPGHAIQQGHRELARRHGLPQHGSGSFLIGCQDLAGMLRVGDREGRFHRQGDWDQQSGVRHASHDAAGDPGGACQFSQRHAVPVRPGRQAPCVAPR